MMPLLLALVNLYLALWYSLTRNEDEARYLGGGRGFRIRCVDSRPAFPKHLSIRAIHPADPGAAMPVLPWRRRKAVRVGGHHQGEAAARRRSWAGAGARQAGRKSPLPLRQGR